MPDLAKLECSEFGDGIIEHMGGLATSAQALVVDGAYKSLYWLL